MAMHIAILQYRKAIPVGARVLTMVYGTLVVLHSDLYPFTRVRTRVRTRVLEYRYIPVEFATAAPMVLEYSSTLLVHVCTRVRARVS